MEILIKPSLWIILLLILMVPLPQDGEEPNANELRRRRDKWLTVESWTAEHKETYKSEKTWETTPGIVMTFSFNSSITGSFNLNELDSDGEYYGEWYGYGYGSGSSYSEQVVTMTSSGSNGEITIRETTITDANGKIGDPSKNEYDEFWGGSLMIIKYN